MLLHIIPHITYKWGGHRTGNCDQMFKLGWGHRTEFKDRGEGDTAHEIVVKCSNLGGDTAQNSKTEGGGHRTKG